MNRDSLSCWPYGVLLAIVVAIVPFTDRFDTIAPKECPHGDHMQFDLPGLVSVNVEESMLEYGELLSMEQLNVQLHAATVGVLLLTVHEIVKYKNYHVSFWSVLPTLSFAFHPLRIGMLKDRCGLPFTSSFFFACIAVLGYLRMLFGVAPYAPSSEEIRNTSSSVVTLGKICLIVLSLLIAIGLNRVTILIPVIMFCYHLMATPKVPAGAGMTENWRVYQHLSVGCALLAVITYCCTWLPVRIGSGGEFLSTSLAEKISLFSAAHEISYCDGDPDVGTCTHAELSSATNTVLNMMCQSCLDVYNMMVLMLLPDVLQASSVGAGSKASSALLMLHGLGANLDVLPLENALRICLVFFTSAVLLAFCSGGAISTIIRNNCYSDASIPGEQVAGSKGNGNGLSGFCGTSRLMFVVCACLFYCHWHFATGLFPADTAGALVAPVLVHLGSTDVRMTAHLSYLSYFPSAVLATYLSESSADADSICSFVALSHIFIALSHIISCINIYLCVLLVCLLCTVGVIISDVFRLPSGVKTSGICEENCTVPTCKGSLVQASFWKAPYYPNWLRTTVVLLIVHLAAICVQYILLVV
jgi:hypothetical protein